MDTILRVIAVYFFVLCAFRLIGKRDLGSLSPFDLVVLMLIPEVFSPALTAGNNSLVNATLGGAALFALMFCTSLAAHRSKSVRKLIEGEPTVLIERGDLRMRQLDLERIHPDEVLAEARKVGLRRLSDVDWAILEQDGRISIIPKSGAERRSGDRGESPGTSF